MKFIAMKTDIDIHVCYSAKEILIQLMKFIQLMNTEY